MPGNYPEENTQHTEHGESFKSRTLQLYGEETAITDAGELPRRKHITREYNTMWSAAYIVMRGCHTSETDLGLSWKLPTG